MGAIKLKKHGNSYGFTIPSSALNQAFFEIDDEYEMMISKNSITFVKRRPHQKNWEFADSKLTKEDKDWLEADLGEIDE
jgi:antitoxin component of MazEF toxin-antitoxin module